MVPSPSFWSRTGPIHCYTSLCLVQSITFTPSLQRCCLEEHLASFAQQRDERNERGHLPTSITGAAPVPLATLGDGGAPRGWQDHVLQQGGFCLPIPAGSRGLCAGREPTHTAVLPAARSREPLVALQELLPAGRSLTRLQGQPPLASAQAPGEQPGALSKTESPLATPQILRLPVKGCSSPRSPQGLLPSLLATGAAGDETQARLGDSQGEQRMPARCWLHAWPRRPSSPLLRAAPLSL